MKTIRSNCFETNSSSTHSVTIVRGKQKENEYKELVIDGVLRPENLQHSPAHHSIEYGEGGSTLTATTKDQKAALFVHHILYAREYDYAESKAAIIKSILKDELIRLCEYSDINTDFYYHYNAYSEYGDCYIDEILPDDEDDFDEAEFRGAVIKHIKNVILDDDARIIESDIPY